jgi:hypothetical protein
MANQWPTSSASRSSNRLAHANETIEHVITSSIVRGVNATCNIDHDER